MMGSWSGGREKGGERKNKKKMFFPIFFWDFSNQIFFVCFFFLLSPPWPSFDAAINWIQFFRHSLYVRRKKNKKQKTFETCARVLEMSQTMWGRYKRVSFIFAAWLLLIYFLPLLLWWWPPLSITSQIDSSGSRGAGNTRRELAAAAGRNAFLTGWVADGFNNRQWRRLVNSPDRISPTHASLFLPFLLFFFNKFNPDN